MPVPAFRNGAAPNFELFPVYCVKLYLLSLTHKQLQAGTANQRQPPLQQRIFSAHFNQKQE